MFDSSECGPANIDDDERRSLVRGRAIIHFISVLIVSRVNMSDDRITVAEWTLFYSAVR